MGKIRAEITSASQSLSPSLHEVNPRTPRKCPSVSEGGKARGGYLGVNGVLDQASATWVGHHLSHIDIGPAMPLAWSVTPPTLPRKKDALRHYCLNIYASSLHHTQINEAALSVPDASICSLQIASRRCCTYDSRYICQHQRKPVLRRLLLVSPVVIGSPPRGKGVRDDGRWLQPLLRSPGT